MLVTPPTTHRELGSSRDPQRLIPNPAAPPVAPASPPRSRNRAPSSYPEPPTLLMDRKMGQSYARGELLGEGGFARCYEATDAYGVRFAVKCVCKASLKSTKQQQKLIAEIRIHQLMSHPHIVGFRHVFEDDSFVYMILELCENKTFVEMLKKRKQLTEPEVRHYMWQLLDAVSEIHRRGVIHRDLKLGNFFLTRDMKLKLGDFGLAASIKHDGERKKTICGTPNYIAPEVLFDTQTGHSYEVDIWSLGVVMYTFLIGRPPFQTKDVKAIYKKIRDNNYDFPPQIKISREARGMIEALLQSRPELRPSVDGVMNHEFFSILPFPQSMPVLALTAVPDFAMSTTSQTSLSSSSRSSGAGASSSPLSSSARAVQPPLEEAFSAPADNRSIPPQMDLPPGKSVNRSPTTHQAAAVPPTLPPKDHSPKSPLSLVRDFGRLKLDADNRPPIPSSWMSRQKSQDASGGVLAPARTASLSSEPDNSPGKSNGYNGRTTRGMCVVASDGHIYSPILLAILPESLRETNHSRREDPDSDSENAGVALNGRRSKDGRGSHAFAQTPPSPRASNGTSPPGSNYDRAVYSTRGAQPTDGARLKSQKSLGNLLQSSVGSRQNPGADNSGIALNGSRSKDGRGSCALATQAPPSPRASTDTAPSHANSERVADIQRSVLSEMHANLQAALSKSSFSSVDHSELSPPRVFISKWIDYSNKYGVGYHLRGGSVGVYFNDSTSLILAADKHHCEYLFYDRGDNPSPSLQRIAFTRTSYPPDLKKKMTLLDHFWGYMQDNLNTAVQDSSQPQISQQTENLDFLTKYVRTHQGVIFRLSNQIVQLNLFDHSKIILSRAGLVVTYIDRDGTFATRSLASFVASGDPDVRKRLCYLMEILSHMIAKKQKRAAAAVAAADMAADTRRGVLAERQGP
ncbi:Cell cycle serine/threonine-protein kinase cdc5/MSD2 [Geranomyces variabilis]|nr:Cell cycle serine/threonine-protein kinase cdc5/MSD2 [Geranomyces variabilis]